MRLSPVKFNALFNEVGQQASWRKSFACPCLNPHSGQARPDCPQCSGMGRLWAAGVPGMAAVAGRDAQRNWASFGRWDSGDVVISIPSDSPLYAIGEFDRVVLENRTEPFSINITPGINDEIRVPIVSVDRVFWLDDAQAVVEGVLPAISADGTLDWGASPPPEGVTYSLTGRRKAEHYVFYEMPSDRPHHAGAALPRKVVLRRFDLFGAS